MNKYKLDRDNTILMVIDIQERLVPVMEYADEVVESTNILIEMAKEMDIPVITTEQYPKGLGRTVEELIDVIDHNELYSKNSFTAYTGDIKDRIDELNKKQIIIVGMETHICVYQTTRDLINAGYEVYLPKEGLASRTTENYENGLYLLDKVGGVISNTETILFDLLGVAGTPEFKKLSPLIK